mgnify:CR=1 FL=1
MLPTLDYGDEAAAWVSKVIGKEGFRINYSAPWLNKRFSINVDRGWPHDSKEGEQVRWISTNKTTFDPRKSVGLTSLSLTLNLNIIRCSMDFIDCRLVLNLNVCHNV